jgi:hypothetical protein
VNKGSEGGPGHRSPDPVALVEPEEVSSLLRRLPDEGISSQRYLLNQLAAFLRKTIL